MNNFVLLLTLLVGTVGNFATVGAFPYGAGGCAGPNEAAVGGLHLDDSGRRPVAQGALADGAIQVTVGGNVLSPTTINDLDVGEDLVIEVEALDIPFLGVLVRLEVPDGVETEGALIPGVNTKQADVCLPPLAGITHIDGAEKVLTAGNLRFDEEFEGGNLTVTVVFINSKFQKRVNVRKTEHLRFCEKVWANILFSRSTLGAEGSAFVFDNFPIRFGTFTAEPSISPEPTIAPPPTVPPTQTLTPTPTGLAPTTTVSPEPTILLQTVIPTRTGLTDAPIVIGPTSVPTSSPFGFIGRITASIVLRLEPVDVPLIEEAKKSLAEACALFYGSFLTDVIDISCEVFDITRLRKRALQVGERALEVGLVVSGTPVGNLSEDEFAERLVNTLNENPDTFTMIVRDIGTPESRAYFSDLESASAYDPEVPIPSPSQPPVYHGKGKGGKGGHQSTKSSKRSGSKQSKKNAKGGGKGYGKGEKFGKNGMHKGHHLWYHRAHHH